MIRTVSRAGVFLILLLSSLTLYPTTVYAQTECETSHGGECRVYKFGRCPDGFDPSPVGDFGELGCSATRRCCVPLVAGDVGEPFKPDECSPYGGIAGGKYTGLQTAIGCLPTHPLVFFEVIAGILFRLGGGIAFLLMIVGAAFILTSRGQPERIQRGKEIFAGAFVGLLIMLGAIFILGVIGIDILGIFAPWGSFT